MFIDLGLVGVSTEDALALSALFGLGFLMVGLTGGIALLIGKREGTAPETLDEPAQLTGIPDGSNIRAG